MGKALIIVVAVAVTVYALFDLIATPRQNIRFLPKPVWFLVLVLPLLGPLLWIAVGSRPYRNPPPKQAPPRFRRPPTGPDDDPDYLRGL